MVDGQPMAEGSISFLPTEGATGPSAGGIIRDGEYRIPAATGPVVGRSRVEIRGFRQTGKTVRDVWKPGQNVAERVIALGPEFNDRSTLAPIFKPATTSSTSTFPAAKTNSPLAGLPACGVLNLHCCQNAVGFAGRG